MKKTSLFLSALTLLSLVSCHTGGSSQETPITLYQEDSMIVGSSYGSADSIPLPTYRHKDFGSVPFINVADFLSFVKSDVAPAPSVKKLADGLYAIESDGVLAAFLDAKNEVLTVKRFDYLVRAFTAFNNGVPFDSANPSIVADSSVHPSEYTKSIGQIHDEVYDLAKYHMDIVEQDGKVYLPLQLFSNLILRCVGGDIIYNGHDYFVSALSGLNEASCYTANDTFRYGGGLYTQTQTVPVGEAHRYVGIDPKAKSDDVKYGVFALKSDGTGAFFHTATAQGEIPEKPEGLIQWKEKDGDMYVGVRIWNPTINDYAEEPAYMRIRHDGGYFNSKTREKALADFNYDLLRFQFDELYGLREDLAQKKGYVDFDSFAIAKGLKEDLLSLDTRVYDEALADFTMRFVDDGHTRYSSRSLFTGVEEKDATDLVREHVGARYQGLMDKLTEYSALRKKVTGLEEPVGLQMQGETAVIRFDSFAHIAATIPPVPSGAETYPLSLVMSLSTPWGFDLSMEQIKKNSSIKNIVLDLTCNGGGMVLTLPYLAAYFTKDPVLLGHDASMGVDREFHYKVDLNHDGVFGGPGDTYADQYNIFLLTSDFSFSCGTAFPAMARLAGTKIIGKRSGGGACSVGTYVDACGSVYNTSSPLQIGYRDENGQFLHDDAGIPVDYELSMDSWYDMAKLDAFVTGIVNSSLTM